MSVLYRAMHELELAQELEQAGQEYCRIADELMRKKDHVQWNECEAKDLEALTKAIEEAKSIGSVTDFVDHIGGIEQDDTSASFKETRRRAIEAHGAVFFALADAQAILDRELQVQAKIKLSESILPYGCLSRTDEAKVKQSGEIWIIKKGDPDPNPSSPHAHNYAAGLKLDLTNGDLYRSGTKIYVGKWITKKDLLKLRDKFEKFGVPMPALNLESSKRFSSR